MEELKINKISTANENKTGAIEHKFLIWTSNKDDQVECVVKIGKKTWNEYSEIAAAETSNNAYLRCCVNIKGCNEVELWDKDQLTGFNWIVYPISSWTGDLQEAVKLMRLRAKNPGSGTLFGLCGRERRPANYNIILINAIASTFIVVTATGMLVIALLWGKRKNKILLNNVELIKLQMRSRRNSSESISSAIKTGELFRPHPPTPESRRGDSSCHAGSPGEGLQALVTTGH